MTASRLTYLLQRFLLVMVVLACALASPNARAEIPAGGLSLKECADQQGGSSIREWQFTTRLVACIRGTIIEAVVSPTNPQQGLLPTFSRFMTPLIAVMMLFGILVFGIRILSGEQDLKRRAIGFLLRIGLVLFFAYNLGGFAQAMFAVMDDMICLVGQPVPQGTVDSATMSMPGVWPERGVQIEFMSNEIMRNCAPWSYIDKIIGRMFGFGENILLSSGLIGIVAGTIFSGTIGLLIFTVGLMAFLDVVFLILRLLFLYLTSVVVLAFMIIVSPLIIPMALFYTRENYFTAWLRIVMVCLLMPMFAFAFIGMFIGIYDLILDRIINIISGVSADGNPQFDAYWRANLPKFSWLLPSDPNLAQDFEKITRSDVVGSPAVQTFINPYARRAMDMSGFVVAPGVDFGPGTVKIEQQLVLGFISLWLFSALLKSMIGLIPGVVQGIAKATINIGAPSATLESGIRRSITALGRPT
jgi:hypothetical protein